MTQRYPEPFVPRVVLDEAIRILKSAEYREWTPFESHAVTEKALHRLIQSRLFEARSRGQVVLFRTGKPRYLFRIRVTGGWNRHEVVMQAIFDTNRVAPELIDERHYKQREIEVRTEDYYEVRFRDLGEQAAKECQLDSGESLIRQTIIDASNSSLSADVYIDQWEDVEARCTPPPRPIAAAQAIASHEINVNIAVPGASSMPPREANREFEKPGGKHHNDLMECVHKHRCASPVVTWNKMPDAVAGEGFFRHATGNLHAWYKNWKSNGQSV